MIMEKKPDFEKLHKALNEFYAQFNATHRNEPELWPELNPDNWSDEYRAFREKYPDDHYKRVFISKDRFTNS